jgi:two-component system CheB/CheR fusion protein
VTAFFRDGAPWDALRTTVIPELLEARGPDGPIRIWSAGCASGEETYSVAMLFAEALGAEAFGAACGSTRPTSTTRALGDARAAVYSRARVEQVPADLVSRYFDERGDRFALRPGPSPRGHLRAARPRAGSADFPHLPARLPQHADVFHTDIQSRICRAFHFALTDDGLLLLGKAETLLTRSELFAPLDLRRRLFRKINHQDPRAGLAALVPPRREDTKAAMSKPTDMYSVAFEAAPIAHIVIDAGGTLAMYNDRARGLFGLVPADVGRPFHELELSYRPVELRSMIQDAQAHRRLVVVKDVRLEGRTASRAPSTCR